MKKLIIISLVSLSGCVSIPQHRADYHMLIFLANQNTDINNKNFEWVAQKIFKIQRDIDKINDELTQIKVKP